MVASPQLKSLMKCQDIDRQVFEQPRDAFADLCRVISSIQVDEWEAAVVTGASTGIGYAVVEQLSASGWQVWGGTRSDSGASKLEMSVGVSSLQIEVTDEYSVKTAFDEVLASRGSSGLDLLVVNAGIVIGGPLEYVSERLETTARCQCQGAALSIRRATLEMCNSSRIIVVGSINSKNWTSLVESICS